MPLDIPFTVLCVARPPKGSIEICQNKILGKDRNYIPNLTPQIYMFQMVANLADEMSFIVDVIRGKLSVEYFPSVTTDFITL